MLIKSNQISVYPFHISDEALCPTNCSCGNVTERSAVKTAITCHNLYQLPTHFPQSMCQISLHASSIGVVPNNSFTGCWDLQEIRLGHSGIKSLEAAAFHNLTNLVVLDLCSNSFNLSEESLPKGLFDDLSSLEVLDISGNHWEWHNHYRDDLMKPLKNLQYLVLDGLKRGVAFGDGFSYLSSLTTLRITGGLNIIRNDTFVAFSKCPVKNMTIFQSELIDLEPLSFANFSQLVELSFVQNLYVGLYSLSHSWYSLQLTNISRLNIKYCWPIDANSIVLNETFFHYLQLTNITTLHLHDNNVKLFHPFFSKYLPHLKRINIIELNLFSVLGVLHNLHKMNHLQYLKLEGIFHTQIQPKPFLRWLQNNNHSIISNPILNPESDSFFIWVNIPPSLRSIAVTVDIRNDFYLNIPKVLVNVTNHSPSHLQLIQVFLKQPDINMPSNSYWLRNPFLVETKHLYHPLTLNLAKNCIKDIHQDVFKSILQAQFLHTLNLSETCLAESFNGNAPKRIFQYKEYSSLVVLDLSYNSITFIATDAFNYLKSLQTLILRGNFLRKIKFSIQNLDNLTLLDLSQNLISYFDSQTIAEFKSFSNGQNLSIDLSGNPIVCACTALHFITWMMESPIRFIKLRNTQCSLGDTIISLQKISRKELQRAKVQCQGRAYIIWCSVTLCISFLILATAFCIYRHRWDVKYFCLNLRQYRKLKQTIDDRKVYKYDAFVAFHQGDIHWVKTELIAKLEEPQSGPTFKLCIHQRDWLAGIPIEENVLKSIQNSRKTIIVLTRKFVQSGWCDFETQMAKLRSFEEGQDIIVLIMLEPVPAAELTGSLKTLVRRLNYIEWPLEENEQDLFWDRLRKGLKKDGPLLPTCECGKSFQRGQESED